MDAAKPGPLSSGSTFLGKYEVRALLGRGGHAFVYEAYDPFLDRVVAIKVIKSLQDVGRDLGKRARAEAQVLSRVDHKNLVKVLDAGIADGLVYLIMEKLVGRTLRDALREVGRVSVAEALVLGEQVAAGMELAHREQVIHRDLKPENIFIEAGNALKVLDFGIAKVLGIAGHRPETTEKDLLQGTVLYMSPEHLQGFGVTPKSDIYALGTILFEALYAHPLAIGERPAGLQEAAWMQIARMPTMLDELDPAIPRYVAKLVQRAIVKMPEQRYASMRDFREALSAALARLQEESRTQPDRFVLRDLSGLQPIAAPMERKPVPRDTVRSAQVLTNQVTVQAPYALGGDTEPVSKLPFSSPTHAPPVPGAVHAAPTPLLVPAASPRHRLDEPTPMIYGSVQQAGGGVQPSAAPPSSEKPTLYATPRSRPPEAAGHGLGGAAPLAPSNLAEQPTRSVAPLVVAPSPIAAGGAAHPKSVPPNTAPPVSTRVAPGATARVAGPLLKDRAVRAAVLAAAVVGVLGGTVYGVVVTGRDAAPQASVEPSAAVSGVAAVGTAPQAPEPAPTLMATPAPESPLAAPPSDAAQLTAPSAASSAAVAVASAPARIAAPAVAQPSPAPKATSTKKPTAAASPADAELEQRLKWLDRTGKPAATTASPKPAPRAQETVF